MSETPKILVHWQFDTPSLSNLNSPFFNTTNESSIDSTSSLEFINGQLVAHGYVPSPGLSLDGISNEGYSRVVKCLLALLSQRVEDMSRTEELTTKLRTLTYDHERMVSMHRKATEYSANAEREMNLHKSRLTATLKTLQSSETSHKQTSAELQRTRTLLQGVRATHHAELKKKEKEIERMLEKWQKISDAQTKLSSAPSGMRCLNAAVVEGTEILGKGQGYLEIALEQAEQARFNLSDDNLLLRKLLVRSINELQSILHYAKCLLLSDQNIEEPSPFTMTSLFPVSPPNAASENLDSIFNELRRNVTAISQITTTPLKASSSQIPVAEVERLQGIISALKEEIALSQKQTIAQVVDTQAMFNKFAEDHRIATGEIGDMSIELISGPSKDEAKERLEVLRNELDDERQQFTDAAIRFGKEKATLEAERLKFLEEKRSWQVELILAELPPTPVFSSPNKATAAALSFSPKKSPHKSLHKSPRRTPTKNISVGKVGSGRKAHRVSKRSSPSPVAITYETEVIPPIPALSFPSMKSLAPPTTSLFQNSFVLPPPSPRASLPTKPALPLSRPDSPPQSTTPESDQSPISSPESSSGSSLHAPSTPPAVRHPFPVAKPFALRMIHAYSPAKPSPLSRILMLADSPVTQTMNMNDLSPTFGRLEVVSEEMEEGDLGYVDNARFPRQEPQMSLAAELGVESPPESPLQERKVEPNVMAPVPPVYPRGRVFFPDPNAKKVFTATEKGKGKADPTAPPRAPRTSALGEKENGNMKSRERGLTGGKSGKVSPVLPAGTNTTARKVSLTGGVVMKTSIKSVVKASTTSSSTVISRTKPMIKPSAPPIAGTGPRRVLINSADAPPMGKGWKG